MRHFPPLDRVASGIAVRRRPSVLTRLEQKTAAPGKISDAVRRYT
jgi:hypothetical protein